MKKTLIAALGLYAVTMTVLVIKNTIDGYFTLDAVCRLIEYIEREQIDAEFSNIINEEYGDE